MNLEKDQLNSQEAETALYGLLNSLTLEQMKKPDPLLCEKLLSLYKANNISPSPDLPSYQRWSSDFWLNIEEQETIGKSNNDKGESFYFDLKDPNIRRPIPGGVFSHIFIPSDFLTLPLGASYIRTRLIVEGYNRQLRIDLVKLEEEYPPYSGDEPPNEIPGIPVKITF